MKFRLTRNGKFTLTIKSRGDEERRWPGYLFGGRVRTSTVALILAFLAVWWLNASYHKEEAPSRPSTGPSVPPILDPNFTLVPRSVVPQPTRQTTTTTPTTTPSETTETTSEPPPPFPPPFVLPPPFGPGTTSPATSAPPPGPGPPPTPSEPAS